MSTRVKQVSNMQMSERCKHISRLARRRGKFENFESRMDLRMTLTLYFRYVTKKSFWHNGIRKILITLNYEENPHSNLWEEEEEKAILLHNSRK